MTNKSTNFTSTKRSKKYNNNLSKIKEAVKDRETVSISEAISILQSLDQPKFKNGPTLEVHFKMNINPTKSDQLVRSSVTLPHGNGKKVVIAAFVESQNVAIAKEAGAEIVGGEELIEQIKSEQKILFDKAVAEPAIMKKLPPIARILGVAGVMPNPKTGTVGTNIAEMIKSILGGKVDFKNDKTGNIHLSIGKINPTFSLSKLVENVEAAISAVERAKPEAIKRKYINYIYIATSQSPSIRIR